MRTLLFTGPGGAGTTTLAAAAAVRSAAAGARTLLLSRDGAPLPGLDGVAGLQLRTVDPQRELEALWRAHAGAVAGVVPQLTVPPASSVVPLPGTAELALFAELGRAAGEAAPPDVVVVDAGPLERLAALLALPQTLRWWLAQVLPPRLRALGALRTAAVRAGAVQRGPVDAVLAAVPGVEQLLDRGTLDPAGTRICLVAPARSAAAAAVRTAATVLGLHGQQAAAVLVRQLPAEAMVGAEEWWAPRRREQEAALRQLAEVAELVAVPEAAQPPPDPAALAALLPDGELPAPAPAPPAAPERRDGGWRLTLPLPFAERGAVELTRWSDDLVVTTAGMRRSVPLDALLRRCRVTGGRLVDPGGRTARLEVTFEPDPEQWPADLLGATKEND